MYADDEEHESEEFEANTSSRESEGSNDDYKTHNTLKRMLQKVSQVDISDLIWEL